MRQFLTTVFACLLTLGLTLSDAEAKRMGGGASRGIQRDSATQRQAAPAPAAPQSPAPASPTRRSWLGPLGGLAAGLGLAALLAHLGLDEGLADVLIVLLLALAAVWVFKLALRRPRPQASGDTLHFAGIGGPHMAPTPAADAFGPDSRSPDAAPGSRHDPLRNIPAGFDTEGFLRVAKGNFIHLQAAHDAGRLDEIRDFTSPEMFAEIKVDIDERKGEVQQTDVVALEAELLEVLSEPTRHLASVRFHGMIRAGVDGAAHPFDEVWHLVKPLDGSRGWVLGGIQQLD